MFVGTIKHVQLAAIEHNREVIARVRGEQKLSGMINLWNFHYTIDTKILSSPRYHLR